MEVMGRGRQGQGDKMGSGRQGQGDARKNVNKQEKGAEHRESSPLQANRSDFRHPAMIGLPPPSSGSVGKVGDRKDINCKTKNYLHK